MPRVRVLGIDCGTERTGWGVISSDGRTHRVLGHGVIVTSSRETLEQRLKIIAAGLRDVLAMHQPEAAAVEEVFYSQNVKTALKLAHVRGVALLAIAEAQIALGEYSPLEVKISVVGYGRAEKHQVGRMVRTLTGFDQELETEDVSDALAVAICHATRNRSLAVAARKAQAAAEQHRAGAALAEAGNSLPPAVPGSVVPRVSEKVLH